MNDIFLEEVVAENKQLRARIAKLEDTWTCDKCGGTWPNPHFDNPDLQAEFDAVTTCVHCVSLAMAKKRIAQLEAAQWHDANEPPEHENMVEVQALDGLVYSDFFSCDLGVWFFRHGSVIRWRDLPPMPEGGA